MADTNFVTDAVDKFEKLPTGGKVAVVAITAGVAVFGIVVANKKAADVAAASSSTTPGASIANDSLNGGTALDPTQLFSGTGLLGTPGTTDTVTANGPTQKPSPSPSQSGGIPLPAAKGTSGMSNNFHVISVGSATPFKTIGDVVRYANGGKSKGNWNPSLVYHYRNNAAIFAAMAIPANNLNAKIPASSVQISI